MAKTRKVTKESLVKKLTRAKIVQKKGTVENRTEKKLSRMAIAIKKTEEKLVSLKLKYSEAKEKTQTTKTPSKKTKSVEELEALLNKMESLKAVSLFLDEQGNVVGAHFEEAHLIEQKAQFGASTNNE